MHFEPNWRTTVSDTLVNEALRGQAKALRELDDLQQRHARLVEGIKRIARNCDDHHFHAIADALRAELENDDGVS